MAKDTINPENVKNYRLNNEALKDAIGLQEFVAENKQEYGTNIKSLIVNIINMQMMQPYTKSILHEGYFTYYPSDEEKKNLISTFDTKKKYKREVILKYLPEVDHSIEKDIRTNMVSCCLEVYLRDIDEEINVAELMRDDIEEGLFKPKSNDYEQFYYYEREDAFCALYDDNALAEWFYWETCIHIPGMQVDEMKEYVSMRYIEMDDKVFNPNFNYTFEFKWDQ